jgi:hypothetical protein
MTDDTTKVAQTLEPLVSIFRPISGQSLRAVWQRNESGILDEIIFDFDRVSLLVVADDNDDTLVCRVVDVADRSPDGYVDVSNLSPWFNYIGKHFCWGWVAINQQGYFDGLLLSFELIFPNLLLNVIASRIKVGVIVEMP